MVTDNHYRWDFIGLSTDEKPTPTTSEKVTDGSTFYCSDNSKLYVWYKTGWYERKALGGGGGGGGDDSPITVLTDDDANYTFDGTDYIAAWLLPTGNYVLSPDATISVLVCTIEEEGSYVPSMLYDATYPNLYFIYNFESEEELVDFTMISASPDTFFANLSYVTGELENLSYFSTRFGGTDGVNDGTAGLVPAPSYSQFDSFLCSSGEWVGFEIQTFIFTLLDGTTVQKDVYLGR